MRIRSPGALDALAEHLVEVVLSRADTPDGALLVLETSEPDADAEVCAQILCGLLEALPPEAAAEWSGAASRVFDLGLESGRHGAPCAEALDRAGHGRADCRTRRQRGGQVYPEEADD